jgi:hypothetical protein
LERTWVRLKLLPLLAISNTHLLLPSATATTMGPWIVCDEESHESENTLPKIHRAWFTPAGKSKYVRRSGFKMRLVHRDNLVHDHRDKGCSICQAAGLSAIPLRISKPVFLRWSVGTVQFCPDKTRFAHLIDFAQELVRFLSASPNFLQFFSNGIPWDAHLISDPFADPQNTDDPYASLTTTLWKTVCYFASQVNMVSNTC